MPSIYSSIGDHNVPLRQGQEPGHIHYYIAVRSSQGYGSAEEDHDARWFTHRLCRW